MFKLRQLVILPLLCLLSAPLWADSGVRYGLALSQVGNYLRPTPGGNVRVCTMPATGQPCTPLAHVYLDSALTIEILPQGNVPVDNNGNYTYYAAPGAYEEEISGAGVVTTQYPNILINSLSNTTSGSAGAWSGTTTYASGAIVSYLGALYISKSNGNLNNLPTNATFWTAFVSAGGPPFLGPNPMFDCTNPAYGCSGSAVTTTGNMLSGTAALTIASVGDFKNGQGIAVFGAGATSSAATPTGGFATVIGTTGSTTHTYKLVRSDSLAGGSAASSAITVTTANATLTYANQVLITLPMPIAEPATSQFCVYRDNVPYGMMVPVWSSSNPAAYNAGTSYSRGTQVSSGGIAWTSLINSNIGNTPASNPTDWTPESTAVFPDIGSAPGCTSFFPMTPPASAWRQALVTSIISGGGTTTLGLAANAQANVSTGTVIHDDSAAIVAAANAARTANPGVLGATGGTVYLPQGTYQFVNLALPAINGGGSYIGGMIKLQFVGQMNTYTPVVWPSQYQLIGTTGVNTPGQGAIAPESYLNGTLVSPVLNLYGTNSALIQNVNISNCAGDCVIDGTGGANNEYDYNTFQTEIAGVGSPFHRSEGFGTYGSHNTFLADGYGQAINLCGPSAQGATRWIWLDHSFLRNHTICIGQTTSGGGQVDQINFDGLTSEGFGTTSGPANVSIFNVNTTLADGGLVGISLRNADIGADNNGLVYFANITTANNGNYAGFDGENLTGFSSSLFAPGSGSPILATFVHVPGTNCASETVTGINCVGDNSNGIRTNMPGIFGSIGTVITSITAASPLLSQGGSFEAQGNPNNPLIRMNEAGVGDKGQEYIVWKVDTTGQVGFNFEGATVDLAANAPTLNAKGDYIVLRSDGAGNYETLACNVCTWRQQSQGPTTVNSKLTIPTPGLITATNTGLSQTNYFQSVTNTNNYAPFFFRGRGSNNPISAGPNGAVATVTSDILCDDASITSGCVGLYQGAKRTAGTGGTWGGNPLVTCQVTITSTNPCYGTEIDLNNLTSNATSSVPADGLLILNGAGSFKSNVGALIGVGGCPGSCAGNWLTGVAIGSSDTALILTGTNFNLLTGPLLAATSSNNYIAAPNVINSNYWNGSASAIDGWQFNTALGTGTNPYTIFNITHSGIPTTSSVLVQAPAYASYWDPTNPSAPFKFQMTTNGFTGSFVPVGNSISANRTYTIPDASGTLSLGTVEYCGATSGGTQACAKTVETLPFIIYGDVTLNTATSQSITTLPFTAATYSCTGSDLTTAAGIVSFNTYANASVTIQESGGVNTDHLRYMCVGF